LRGGKTFCASLGTRRSSLNWNLADDARVRGASQFALTAAMLIIIVLPQLPSTQRRQLTSTTDSELVHGPRGTSYPRDGWRWHELFFHATVYRHPRKSGRDSNLLHSNRSPPASRPVFHATGTFTLLVAHVGAGNSSESPYCCCGVAPRGTADCSRNLIHRRSRCNCVQPASTP